MRTQRLSQKRERLLFGKLFFGDLDLRPLIIRAKEEKDQDIAKELVQSIVGLRPNAALEAIQARRELIEEFMPLVTSIANKYKELALQRGLEWKDLIQEGNEALAEAVNRFDRKSGNRLSTYAYKRIRGAIITLINEGDPIPPDKRYFAIKVGRVHDMLMTGYDGEKPTTEDIARGVRAYDILQKKPKQKPTITELMKEMEESTDPIPDEEIKKIEEALMLLARVIVPLDEIMDSEKDGGRYYASLIAEEPPKFPLDPELVEKAVRQLPERPSTALRLRFWRDLSYKQIAEEMGLTTENAAKQLVFRASVNFAKIYSRLIKMENP